MTDTCTCKCDSCSEGLHCGESYYEGGFKEGSIKGFACTFIPLESTEPDDYFEAVWDDLQRRR